MAILNSCTDLLKLAVEWAIPNEEQRVGPLVFYNIICRVQPPCHSQTRQLCDKLGAMDITKYPGDNVTQFQADAMKILDEIYMTVLDEATVPELPSLTLLGLQHARDEQLRLEAGRLLDQADQPNRAPLDPVMLLETLNQLYI